MAMARAPTGSSKNCALVVPMAFLEKSPPCTVPVFKANIKKIPNHQPRRRALAIWSPLDCQFLDAIIVGGSLDGRQIDSASNVSAVFILPVPGYTSTAG